MKTRFRSVGRPGVTLIALLLLAGLFPGLAAADEPAMQAKKKAKPGSALAVGVALVDAFNDHDPEAMAALVSSDFELYYFDDKGIAGLASKGREQLVEQMTAYFEARPSVKARIVDEIAGPTFIAFREQIEGGDSSLAVYEVREGLLQRAWYYPAE